MPVTLDPETEVQQEQRQRQAVQPAVTPARGPTSSYRPPSEDLGSYAHHPDRAPTTTEQAGAPAPETHREPTPAEKSAKFEDRYKHIDQGIMASISNFFFRERHSQAQEAMEAYRQAQRDNDPQLLKERAAALEKALTAAEGGRKITDTVAKGLAVTAVTIGVTMAAAPVVGAYVGTLGLGAVASSFVAGGLTAGISSFATRAGFGYLMNGFKFDRDQLLKDAGMSVVDGVCFGGASALATGMTFWIARALSATPAGTAIVEAAKHPGITGAVLRVGTAVLEGAFAGAVGMGAQTAVFTAADPNTYQGGPENVAPTILGRTWEAFKTGGMFGAVGGFFAGLGRIRAPKTAAPAQTLEPAPAAATEAPVTTSQPEVAKPVTVDATPTSSEVSHTQAVVEARAEATQKLAALTKKVDPDASAAMQAESDRLSRVAQYLDDTTPAKPKGDWVDDLFKQVSPAESQAAPAAEIPQPRPVQPAAAASTGTGPTQTNISDELADLAKQRLKLNNDYGGLAEYGDLPPSIRERMDGLDSRIAELTQGMKLAQNPATNPGTIDDVLEATANGLSGPPAAAPKTPTPDEGVADDWFHQLVDDSMRFGKGAKPAGSPAAPAGGGARAEGTSPNSVSPPEAKLSDDDLRALWDSSTEVGNKMGGQPRVVEPKKPDGDEWFSNLVEDSNRFGQGGGAGGATIERTPSNLDLPPSSGPVHGEGGGSGPARELAPEPHAKKTQLAVKVAEEDAAHVQRQEYVKRLEQLAKPERAPATKEDEWAETLEAVQALPEAPAPASSPDEDEWAKALESVRALPEAAKPNAIPAPELESLPPVVEEPVVAPSEAPQTKAAPAPSLEEANVPAGRKEAYVERVEKLAQASKPDEEVASQSRPAPASEATDPSVQAKPRAKLQRVTNIAEELARAIKIHRPWDSASHDFENPDQERATFRTNTDNALRQVKPLVLRSDKKSKLLLGRVRGNMAIADSVTQREGPDGKVKSEDVPSDPKSDDNITEAFGTEGLTIEAADES